MTKKSAFAVFNLLERTVYALKKQHQDNFRKLLIVALQRYLDDDTPPAREVNLSDKQPAKRIKNNDKIISVLQDLLENNHA